MIYKNVIYRVDGAIYRYRKSRCTFPESFNCYYFNSEGKWSKLNINKVPLTMNVHNTITPDCIALRKYLRIKNDKITDGTAFEQFGLHLRSPFTNKVFEKLKIGDTEDKFWELLLLEMKTLLLDEYKYKIKYLITMVDLIENTTTENIFKKETENDYKTLYDSENS